MGQLTCSISFLCKVKLCCIISEFLRRLMSCERKCEIWMDDFICIFRGQQTLSLRLFLFHSQSRVFYQRNSYTQQSRVITPEAVFPLHDYVSLQQTAVIFLTTHCSTNKLHWRVNVPTGHCTLRNPFQLWLVSEDLSRPVNWMKCNMKSTPSWSRKRIWTTEHQINDSMMSNQDL